MPPLAVLPSLNACLNGLSALFLALGFWQNRRKNNAAHGMLMLAACASSAVFLASYLYYHAHVGSVHFQGQGPWRALYFAILITHSILAAAVPFLAAILVWRALHKSFEAHKSLARWALPVWFYVSVTGVVVYWMLYHWRS